MFLITILAIALGLAMDALAVAITTGIVLPDLTPRHYFRLSFHFGLFQAIMPVLGWFLGHTIVHLIAPFDHWIALILLSLVGGKMLRDSFQEETPQWSNDPTRGTQLVVLSIATSIDAFAVGLSLGVIGVNILLPAIAIGLVTGSLTLLGMKIGGFLGRRFGKNVERLGGLLLIGIGIKIVLEHLYF